MTGSLQFRLAFSASVVLAAFLGLAGWTLDQAYRQGQDQAMHERLQIHIYSLLGASELDRNGQLQVTDTLQEPRFNLPESGLIAYIYRQDEGLVWRSPSSLGVEDLPVLNLQPGQSEFVPYDGHRSGYNALHYPIRWETKSKTPAVFEFVVAESPLAMQDQLGGYRRILWFGLGGVACLLVVVQLLVLRWSLAPLRTVVTDMERIQMGEASRLEGHYGRELQGVAGTLNSLIENERSHLERYRNTLSDLAHSLKTPLSVLSGLSQQSQMPESDRQLLQEQTQRMRDQVEYQLQRAAARGHKTLTRSVSINPIIEQIKQSLDKVYREQALRVSMNLAPNVRYFCESGDMYELVGNLLDNAYKWAKQKVRVQLQPIQDASRRREGVCLMIEDDGPGMPPDRLDELFQRGTRADEQVAGHGIGLAVVKELIELYGGTLQTERSQWGGQKWVVRLPSRI